MAKAKKAVQEQEEIIQQDIIMEKIPDTTAAEEVLQDKDVDLEEFYVTLARSIQEFADNTRQAVVDFQFSREDLVKVSIAVDMMANAINLLRNYVNFYIDDVAPERYENLYVQMSQLTEEDEQAYADETTLEDDLKEIF